MIHLSTGQRRLLVIVVGVGMLMFLSEHLTPDQPADGHPPPSPVAAPPGPIRADRAREALDRLVVAPPAAPVDYVRDAYGSGWLDLDSDGCNTREEVLARDMRGEVRPDGCNVETGTLIDPYTGARIEFVEDVDAAAVQVDHVIALAYAWVSGAWHWTDDKRERFANDPLNLLAVDGPTNASKSAQGAAAWRPPNEGAWCLYSVRYVRVAAIYDLTVTATDRSALIDMLGRCP